jgi:hypothetical protein
MHFYIKDWPDHTATLMTECGRVVWNFPSVEEAEDAAKNGCDLAEREQGKLVSVRAEPRLKAVA